MLCPVCIIDLYMSERQGIEIDYCPQCHGVWLDRCELDKIIEHSDSVNSREYQYKERRETVRDGDHRRDHWRKKKKNKPRLKSFLGELSELE
jgi:uncharacterized protein